MFESELFELIGLDERDLEWGDLAVCAGMDINLFFDGYEADELTARITDEACLSCPVMIQCLEQGMDNGETGVWGGIYLTNGRPDPARNVHKNQDTWNQIRERIGDNTL